MPLLKWKDEYTVHVTELDSHHIKLFDILNAAYENVVNSSEAQCVKAVVSELSEYMNYHFTAEEQLMKDNGYQAQELTAHIAEHRHFADKINALKAHHHDSDLEAAQELIIVLGNWVLQHILVEDRKYSKLISLEG